MTGLLYSRWLACLIDWFLHVNRWLLTRSCMITVLIGWARGELWGRHGAVVMILQVCDWFVRGHERHSNCNESVDSLLVTSGYGDRWRTPFTVKDLLSIFSRSKQEYVPSFLKFPRTIADVLYRVWRINVNWCWLRMGVILSTWCEVWNLIIDFKFITIFNHE